MRGSAVVAVAGLALMGAIAVWAGPLNPPAGPVTPTYKTLQDVEPRVPVQSLVGNAGALFVISAPGSYYLADNVQGVAGKHGILIASDNVSLDLRGFAVMGIGAGAFDGITTADAGAVKNISVTNGTVRGWGRHGIHAVFGGVNCLISGVRSSDNGVDGFQVYRTVLRDCGAATNIGNGFTVYESTVRDCIAEENLGNGITGFFGSTIEHCSARANSWGFFCTEGTVVTGCASQGNNADGYVLGNYAYAHGNTADTNGGKGFVIYSGAPAGVRIEDNVASRNTVRGFDLTGGTGCLMIRNSARGNGGGAASNYFTVAGNGWGSIIGTLGDLNATPPTANFSY
jgi:parallel beta-helix repeat protein